MNNHHHQNPNTLIEVSIFDTLLNQSNDPNSTCGLVAMTKLNAILSSACPRNTFLSHPRNTVRRSIARSFSFLVILARMASASSPPPPASACVVVRGVLLLGMVAPVSVASSERRL